MDNVLPFVNKDIQNLIITKQLKADRLYSLLFENLPEQCEQQIYQQLLLIPQEDLIKFCLDKPNYKFLQSQVMKDIDNMPPVLKIISGNLSSSNFVSQLVFKNSLIYYQNDIVTVQQLSLILYAKEFIGIDELIILSIQMLKDNEIFIACHHIIVKNLISCNLQEKLIILLNLYVPILLKPLSSNIHILKITENVKDNILYLAFDVVYSNYSVIVDIIPFQILQIITKSLLSQEKTGIFEEFLSEIEDKAEIILFLQNQVSLFYKLISMSSKDTINYDMVEFLKQNSVKNSLKFNLLSKNLTELKRYFQVSLQNSNIIETSPFLRIVRQCLSDFLLSGEGQAVEKVVQTISQLVSEQLNIDQKTCMFVVCGITMLNTQFDFELQGKKLNRYIFKADFVKMMSTSPGFDQIICNQEYLELIYDNLKQVPLGLQHNIFEAFSCEFMTFDYEISQKIGDLDLLITKIEIQKPNYDIAQYFYRTQDRLQFGLQQYDNQFAITPIILEHALSIIQNSNNLKQVTYYLGSIKRYCLSIKNQSNYGTIFNISLILLSLSGFQESSILFENDQQQIAQIRSNAKIYKKPQIIFQTLLEIIQNVNQFNKEEFGQLTLVISILNALKLSDIGSSQPFINTQYFILANFKNILSSLQFIFASNKYDIIDYTNLKYLLFSQVQKGVQKIQASKYINSITFSLQFQYEFAISFCQILTTFLQSTSELKGIFLHQIMQIKDQMKNKQQSIFAKINRNNDNKYFRLNDVIQELQNNIVIYGTFSLPLKESYELLEKISAKLSLQDYQIFIENLQNQTRFKQIVMPFIPKFINFSQLDIKLLEKQIVYDIQNNTDRLGLKFFLDQVITFQNLNLLFQIIGGQVLDLSLLKQSIEVFLSKIQPVLFESSITNNLAEYTSDNIESNEINSINFLLGFLILKYQQTSPEVDIGDKIEIQHFTIGVLLKLLGLKGKGKFAWINT